MKMFGNGFRSKLPIYAVLLLVLSIFNAMHPADVPAVELSVHELNSSAVVEEGSGSRYMNRIVEDFNNDTMVERGNTTCSVRSMEGRAYLWGSSPVIPPTYEGQVNQETRSHGGGFSPKYNEYWYPNWAGSTIYRYGRNHNYIGSFNSGAGEIMQVWGDKDGTYYTANWNRDRVYKWSDMGSSQIWSTHLGSSWYVGGVCCDDDYVYAMKYYETTVRVLRKDNGQQVRTFNINGGSPRIYGSLACANGYLYVGGYNNDYRRVGIFQISDGSYVSSFNVQENIYNMAFDGEYYCISRNQNSIHRYKISDGNAYLGDEVEPPTNITHFQSKILHRDTTTIGAARMTWYEHKPPGTDIEYKLTADGKNWIDMENGTTHIFEHQGSPMKWNGTIKTDDKSISPYIDKVVIEYDLVSVPSPKGPSSAVWHGTSTPTLEWNFTDPDRGDHQSEFLIEIYNNSDMDRLVYNSTWSNSSNPSHKISEAVPDGIYFWRVRTKDVYHAASNWSVLKKFKIDTTKPVGSIIIEEDVLSVNEQLIDLAIEATDNASGVADMQIINDRGNAGPWEEYGTAKRIVLESTDGLKTIGVRFRDNAGIVSVVFNDTVYFDLKGPFDVEMSSPSHPDPEVYYNNTGPVFEWEPPHEVTGIKGYSYMIDTSKHTEPGKVLYNPRSDQASTSPGEFSGLNDGIWYFHITPCDEYDQWGNTTHFQFNIDTREPVLYDLGPDNKEWTNETSIRVSVVMEDIDGFGLDTDSIQYSHRTHGGSFSPWTGEGLKFDVLKKSLSENPSKVKVRVDIPLAEGTGNAVRWRVSDLSGNGPAQSPIWKIKMDGTPVTFGEPVPSAGEYTIDIRVTCGVTISDGAGCGVDGTTVQYSVSTSGPELANFKTWISVKTNTVRESISVIHEIAFDAGTENYIMWRAKDGVGNGYAYSEAYQVWVNSAPLPVISSPTNSAVFSPGDTISLSASGTTDNEGDELNYYWEVKNRTTKRVVKQAFGAESNITLLETGRFIVYLHVDDGHDFNESAVVDIHVFSSGSGPGDDDDDDTAVEDGSASLLEENWLYLLLGFGSIVLILVVFMVVVARRKRKKEKDESPTAIRRPMQRPMPRPMRRPSSGPSYRQERPYSSGGHDFSYPSSYSEGAASHPYSPYNPPGQATLPPPQSAGSVGARAQPQGGGYGFSSHSQAGSAPGLPCSGQTVAPSVSQASAKPDIHPAAQQSMGAPGPLSNVPASDGAPPPIQTSEPLPSLPATPTVDLKYILPTVNTDKGLQDLNMMALPPAPEADVVPALQPLSSPTPAAPSSSTDRSIAELVVSHDHVSPISSDSPLPVDTISPAAAQPLAQVVVPAPASPTPVSPAPVSPAPMSPAPMSPATASPVPAVMDPVQAAPSPPQIVDPVPQNVDPAFADPDTSASTGNGADVKDVMKEIFGMKETPLPDRIEEEPALPETPICPPGAPPSEGDLPPPEPDEPSP